MPNENERPTEGQQQTGRTNNRGMNLSQQDRSRGGQHSAQSQQRDAQGQFAGKKGSSDSGNRPGASANWRDEAKSTSRQAGSPSKQGNVSGPKLPNDKPDQDDVEESTKGRRQGAPGNEDELTDDPDRDETQDQSTLNRSVSTNAR